MAKYVYPGTSREDWNVRFHDYETKGVKLDLKSTYYEGRIIADDNTLR